MRSTLLIFIIFFTVNSQSYREQVETKLQEIFGNSIELEYKKVALPKKVRVIAEKKAYQRFFRPELYSWKMKIDSVIKYVILDNVVGKVQPITFMVIYDEKLSVEFVEVLKYRESRGYEVGNESFLTQFIGKSKESDFSIGSSIKNISGATISVNSMSKGVDKLSTIVQFVSEQF